MTSDPAAQRLVRTGLAILALELVLAIVAVALDLPAQFGGEGTDAGDEVLTRGTALSAPLAPMVVLAVATFAAHRGRRVAAAGVMAPVAALMLVGSIGEAVAPATPEVDRAVLVASGVLGVVLAAVVARAVLPVLRGRRHAPAAA